MIFVDNCTGNNAYIGDLYCDDENNNIFCQFDGGDCCNSWMTQQNFCEECACFKGKYRIVTSGNTSQLVKCLDLKHLHFLYQKSSVAKRRSQ